MADAEQVKDAAEVYVYGYPLVYDLKEVAGFVEGGGSLPMQAPYNSFAPARRLLGPETRFVSPNNDTLSPTSGGGPPAPPRRSTCSPTATTMDRSPTA